ncbi:hypothetical protein [Haloplanus halophilus]|uniref:hypothetical protein n=1 Tax=Haloplanus halophilus TaxID=2949993 RepID=UPI00203EDD8E|nr:hypothetical protein [Haloplanus sp. GDY1]
MAPSDGLDETEVRAIVRDELLGAGRTLLGLVLWTVLAVFAGLVGLQLFQLALYTTSTLALVGFALGGTVVTGASLYLLYLLHWA